MDPTTLLTINLVVLFVVFVIVLILADGDAAKKLGAGLAASIITMGVSSVWWFWYVVIHFIAKYW